MSLTPFYGLAPGFYGAILCDCPWAWRNYSGKDGVPHRTAADPYPVMSFDDLASMPVAVLAAPDCALFMWVVSSHVDQVMKLGEAWGFKYKSKAFEWFKCTKDGSALRMGMGKWTRQESETCFIFTRGSPRRLNADVRSTIWESAREHSRKPDETYNRIERLVAGPYAELFATQRREGWDGWGRDYPL